MGAGQRPQSLLQRCFHSQGIVQTAYLRQLGNKPVENPVLNQVVQLSILTNGGEEWGASRQSRAAGWPSRDDDLDGGQEAQRSRRRGPTPGQDGGRGRGREGAGPLVGVGPAPHPHSGWGHLAPTPGSTQQPRKPGRGRATWVAHTPPNSTPLGDSTREINWLHSGTCSLRVLF